MAVILCELEGRSRKDVAARLGIPAGTLSSRLAKARKLLAARLSARGVTASAAAVTAALAGDATARVPASVVAGVARAVGGGRTMSAVAARAAEAVVKAMLVTNLKAVGAAVVVMAGLAVGATAGPVLMAMAAAGTDPAPTDAAALVRQLGSPTFADREAAEARLKALGHTARAAVRDGARGTDPEIARRCADLLDHFDAADRAAFAARFRADAVGTQTVDHPVWRRYVRITGDTPASRRLFADMIRDPVRFRRLADAASGPAAARRAYADQFPDSLGNVADLAAAFLLGTHDATGDMLLPDRRENELDRGSIFVEMLTLQFADPVRKLFAAWLASRTDADVLADGLQTARACNVAECLPVARALAADAKRGPRTRADALLVVAAFGTPADVPLARPLLVETLRYGTWLIGNPARAEVRDIAAATMLMLHGQKPWDYGFTCAFRETKVPGKNERCINVYGFATDEARAAAHRAVLAYVEAAGRRAAAPPPADTGQTGDLDKFLAAFRADTAGTADFAHPLWKRFTAVAGSDASARALFAAIVADRGRAERLAAAVADPASAGERYAAEIARVRLFADAFNKELAKKVGSSKDKGQEAWWADMRKALDAMRSPVGDVSAALFLGTFPATADVSLGEPGPKRLRLNVVPVGDPFSVSGEKFAWCPAARRLLAAWLEVRRVTDDQAHGMRAAAGWGLNAALPLARRWAADPLLPPKVRGTALLLVGQLGGRADRPLADALFDDGTVLETFQGPGPADPTRRLRAEATVGDVALAVSVHLAGGNPAELGFGRIDRSDWALLKAFMFTDEAARQAAYRKAKGWLAAHP